MNSRPNILIIQADQLAARYLGAYQNPIARTPHIDSLAANGATTPLLMAKQGHTRYVFSAVDPEQLFDLELDPLEQTKQITNPEYRDTCLAMSQLARQQWDIETLTRQLPARQKRWLFLREALAQGKHADRDFTAEDKLEQHCLHTDKAYSQWAYQDIPGYRVPQK